MINRKKRIINGFMLRTVYMVLNVAIAFFMMPFILHTLGDRMYSVWILVGAFVGYSGYLDLGLSSAVQRFLSRGVGRGDTGEINEIINTSFVLYLVIGLATLLVTFGLAAGAGIFMDKGPELTVVRTLIVILGTSTAIGFPTRAFGSIISSHMRYEVTEGIELLCLILRNALILVLLSVGYGVVSMGAVQFVVSLLSYSLYVFFSFYLIGGVRFDLKLFNKDRVWELFSYSFYTFVYKLSEILIFKIDSVVISYFMGLAIVSHYAIASTLVSYFSYFMFGAFSLIGPAYSQDESRGDMDGVRHKFIFTTKIAVYITVFISSMAIFYGKPFIQRWMGEAYIDSYPALVILIIASTVMLMQMPTMSVLYNISKHKFLAVIGVVEALLNVFLSISLVRHYGMVGVALGTAVPMVLIRLFVQPYYVCKTLSIGMTKYYFNVVGASCVVSIMGLLPAYYYLSAYSASDYLRLALLGCSHAVLYAVVVLVAGFTKAERKYLLGYIGKGLEKTPLYRSV